jgi:DNA-directed RNA polymerase specialized sigma24 family protein
MKERTHVRTQKLTDVKGSPGAYERYITEHGFTTQKGKLGDRFDFVTEPTQANPDSLREDQATYADSQMTKAQELMGLAVEHLQGKQKQVYLLTLRQGLSIANAAKQLGITKSDAQGYRDRAIKFITSYCRGVLANE